MSKFKIGDRVFIDSHDGEYEIFGHGAPGYYTLNNVKFGHIIAGAWPEHRLTLISDNQNFAVGDVVSMPINFKIIREDNLDPTYVFVEPLIQVNPTTYRRHTSQLTLVKKAKPAEPKLPGQIWTLEGDSSVRMIVLTNNEYMILSDGKVIGQRKMSETDHWVTVK